MQCSILQRMLAGGAIIALSYQASACGTDLQGSSESGEATLESQVDAVLDRYTETNGPGFAIGIILGSEFVIAKGYGLADIESGRSISADTALNLASLSKQFTGAAVALEIGKGTISLDDPLNRHWPISTARPIGCKGIGTNFFRVPGRVDLRPNLILYPFFDLSRSGFG